MRAVYMGIMVGIGTVLADDPMLNVRIGDKRSPVRIICDSNLRLPLDSRICKTAKDYRTIVACATDNPEKKRLLEELGVEILCVSDEKGQVELKKLMSLLGEMGIDSVFIEGGGCLNDSALRAGIVNKIYAFVAPKIFGGEQAKTPVSGLGVELPEQAVRLKLQGVERIGEDLLLEYTTQNNSFTINEKTAGR